MSNQDDFTEYVARVIDAERVAARLSVEDLADRSGVPKRTLYRILNAERDITIRQLSQLAPVFGLRPSDIFADAERRQSRDAPPRLAVDDLIDSAKELTERQKQGLKDIARTNHLPHTPPNDSGLGSEGRDASGGTSS